MSVQRSIQLEACSGDKGNPGGNKTPNLERSGRGRRRRVADMNRIFSLHDQKVVHELPGRRQRLGSDTGLGRNQVSIGDLGDQPLKTFQKRAFTEGAGHFPDPILIVLSRQPPESRKGESLKQISPVYVGLVIALSLEGKHRIWSSVNRTVDHPGKMHTQEGEIGVWDRIDQCLHQMTLVRNQLVILTSEWNDLHARIEATEAGHAIAEQAGAINDESGLKLSVRCLDDLSPIHLAQAVNARAGLHGSTL